MLMVILAQIDVESEGDSFVITVTATEGIPCSGGCFCMRNTLYSVISANYKSQISTPQWVLVASQEQPSCEAPRFAVRERFHKLRQGKPHCNSNPEEQWSRFQICVATLMISCN